MSDSLKLRTLAAHTSRGISRHLTTSNKYIKPAHPLAFSFVLGLGDKLDWYQRPPVAMSSCMESYLLRLIAREWGAPLGELDINCILLRFGCLPEHMHEDAMHEVELTITGEKEYAMKYVSDKVPPEIMSRLEDSLKKLETALLEKDPMMPQHLRNTHSILISYPETVHLLDDEEIARIIDAAEIHTKTEIVKAAAKGKTASRKKVDVGDL